ncbi:ABC transporter ATP-binding protein [Celerinatantimonas sp. MCCC 1A17872]|uniref:ABC transporter ATP-binding protein n=1 Tax=Celerinatantimonas sp. MCCC 1A17872 TaxID=3177514 RepID=UPI0038C3743B
MSKTLRIEQLSVSYAGKQVLCDLSMAIQRGEMVALLGPSGCGKTTLLNALCGFIQADHGQIWLDNENVTQANAQSRQMVQVFQSYALWPHMSVFGNIAYGLKIRGCGAKEIEQRVIQMLKLVKLPLELLKNSVTALSGGQRQRVALARALIVKPSVLLLDEPLSNLDAKVRLSVRHEIKQLQQQLGFTSVLVTHDREEALVMADRIAVMNQGKIEQFCEPETIYHHPNSAFVADFMGLDNHFNVNANKLTQLLNDGIERSGEHHYSIYFRPEDVQIFFSQNHCPVEGICLDAKVTQSVFQGQSYRHGLETIYGPCWGSHEQALESGLNVKLFVPLVALHIYKALSVH